MAEKYKKTEVKSGRIGGLVYRSDGSDKPMLVLFNQWRSGAHSILSKYIAELVLENGAYSAVLFIDRIASGGVSDNQLSQQERESMRRDGEFQFGKVYAESIEKIVEKYGLPKRYALGGSSAGAPAVLATATGMGDKQKEHVIRLVMVEPSGMELHGFGSKRIAALPHAFSKHLIAYRHRLRRGWWTPMDKEQYFAKGTMFEYRAIWSAGNHVYMALCAMLSEKGIPPIELVLSSTSHMHKSTTRENLKSCVRKPHRIKEITGNHDKICQPPSLSEIYTDVLKGVTKVTVPK